MRVLTYNPTKTTKIAYFDRRSIKQSRTIKLRRLFTFTDALLFFFAILLLMLYFREVVFYSSANEKILFLQQQNQVLLYSNQLLKNKLSTLENVEYLKSIAGDIGLSRAEKILYPQQIHYSLQSTR